MGRQRSPKHVNFECILIVVQLVWFSLPCFSLEGIIALQNGITHKDELPAAEPQTLIFFCDASTQPDNYFATFNLIIEAQLNNMTSIDVSINNSDSSIQFSHLWKGDGPLLVRFSPAVAEWRGKPVSSFAGEWSIVLGLHPSFENETISYSLTAITSKTGTSCSKRFT